jgi:hypothetical protein
VTVPAFSFSNPLLVATEAFFNPHIAGCAGKILVAGETINHFVRFMTELDPQVPWFRRNGKGLNALCDTLVAIDARDLFQRGRFRQRAVGKTQGP